MTKGGHEKTFDMVNVGQFVVRPHTLTDQAQYM